MIVEDIEAWHCIYTEVLRQQQSWQIVHIARNAVEAVQKCRELTPDVVLLDIGLGRTDRLEAAQQIKDLCPKSQVLLLGTAESSQLAEVAHSVGAYGYIWKRNVVLDLIPVIQALGKGKRFKTQTAS